MRVVFMGTPELAATVLSALDGAHEVVGVYTRPDAARGRGGAVSPSPVKEAALRLGLDVFTPSTLRDAEVVRQLAALSPDVVCVAAYGAILPREVLEVPRLGCLNVHASLLPRWRGAAPVERAILAGDEVAGVSIMRMEEGLDTGPYCLQRRVEVGQRDVEELTGALAREGAEALLEALAGAEEGTLSWTPQDERESTYADKIGKHELDLLPDDAPEVLLRKVRASSPAHPARAVVAGRGATVMGLRRVEVALAQAADGIDRGEARLVSKRLLLGCAGGAVELSTLRPDGKRSMEGRAFAAGVRDAKRGFRWGGA